MAHYALEESREEYANLYDFAPVGYLTLNRKDFVEEANLVATRLLNIGCDELFSHPFASYVANGYKRTYFEHRQQLIETRTHQRVEVQLDKGDGQLFYTQLDSTVMLSDGGVAPQNNVIL